MNHYKHNTQSEIIAHLDPKVNHLDWTADLNAQHWPVPNTPFVYFTHHHLMLEAKMTPCASLLYHWILLKAPAGTFIKFDLKDFRAWTGEHRNKPYSVKQIRRAVEELETLQLLTLRSEVVEAAARHPGPVVNAARIASSKQQKQSAAVPKRDPGGVNPIFNNETKVSQQETKVSHQETKMSAPETKMSQSEAKVLVEQEFQASTDHPDLFRSTTNNTSHVVVEEKDQLEIKEVGQQVEQNPDEPKVSQAEVDAALVELRALQVKLNRTVRKTVREYFGNVQSAIASLRERISTGENFVCLEAAFVKACKEGELPETALKPLVEYPQPNPEQLEELHAAKRSRIIKAFYQAPLNGGTTFLVDDWQNQRVIPWWQFLQVKLD